VEERLLHGQVRGGGRQVESWYDGRTRGEDFGGGGPFMETFPRSIAAQPRPAGQGT
jgi:hypothetical protein